MGSDKDNKLKERHTAALDQVHVIGQYLIMVEDCPQNVRDAWRVLANFIKEKNGEK